MKKKITVLYRNKSNFEFFYRNKNFCLELIRNFKELIIFHNDKVEELEISKLNVFSKNSFFLNNLLIFSKEKDEIVSFLLNNEYKNIEKILLRFEVKKLKLSTKCGTQ